MVAAVDRTTELLRRWRDDPLAWARTFWPDMRVSAKQAEMLYSLRDNVETFARSGQTMGKSRGAALGGIYLFSTRKPCKGIVSSSSEKQLLNALWPDVASLVRTARPGLGIRARYLTLLGTDGDEENYFVRFMVTKRVESFQGVHLPVGSRGDDPSVFFFFEEASGVPDEFYDAATGQAHRILAISNPLRNSGWFYQQCKKGDQEDPLRPGKLERRVIHIDGDESPNVIAGKRWRAQGRAGPPPTLVPGILGYGEYLYRVREWDVVKRTIKLHGEFYEGDETLMFPPDRLDAAEELWETVSATRRGACWMGVDVAEGGRDLNCWVIVDHLGVVAVLALPSSTDTTMIQTRTLQLMEEWDIPGERICFDRGGGGKQHVDYLRRMGHKVRAVGFGEGATDPKAYKNRRAEMYAHLARQFDPQRWATKPADNGQQERWVRCTAMPPGEHLLREELAVLPVQYDGEGKQYLPPKSRRSKAGQTTLEELLGRSPDRADALALAAWARRRPARRGPPTVRRSLVLRRRGQEPWRQTQE